MDFTVRQADGHVDCGYSAAEAGVGDNGTRTHIQTDVCLQADNVRV